MLSKQEQLDWLAQLSTQTTVTEHFMAFCREDCQHLSFESVQDWETYQAAIQLILERLEQVSV